MTTPSKRKNHIDDLKVCHIRWTGDNWHAYTYITYEGQRTLQWLDSDPSANHLFFKLLEQGYVVRNFAQLSGLAWDLSRLIDIYSSSLNPIRGLHSDSKRSQQEDSDAQSPSELT